MPLWLAHVAVAEAAALRAVGDTAGAARRAAQARAIAARHGFAEIERDLGRIEEGER